LEMHDLYKEVASFICSEDNTNNKKLKDICNFNSIINYSDDYITFDKQILFTTKVLDN